MGEKYTKDHDKIALEKVIPRIGSRSDINQAYAEPRVGDLCPQCKFGHLDYDSLLNLACNQCGYVLVGCFT